MSPVVITLLVGGIVGLIMGFFVARKSAAEKPIQGGTLASVFHYLGPAASVGALPTVLNGTFVYRLGLFRDVPLALTMTGASEVCLLAYPYFEAQAKPANS